LRLVRGDRGEVIWKGGEEQKRRGGELPFFESRKSVLPSTKLPIIRVIRAREKWCLKFTRLNKSYFHED